MAASKEASGLIVNLSFVPSTVLLQSVLVVLVVVVVVVVVVDDSRIQHTCPMV